MTEKLQKVLARAGLGSRREIEGWIVAGLVRVNGRLAQVGDRVGLKDQIMVRGRLIKTQELLTPVTQVLLYNKPEGELVTRSDEKGRETIFDKLPKTQGGRWIAIGRLDINTTGLMLLTNNGELANRLMHPSQEIERAYLVRVFGEVSLDILERLQKGVPLDDGMANFDEVQPLKGMEPSESINQWYKVTLREGRNREVRRLWESQGVRVSRLKRISFGSISLPKSLRLGHSQLATADQVNALLSAVDLPTQAVNAQDRRARPMSRTGYGMDKRTGGKPMMQDKGERSERSDRQDRAGDKKTYKVDHGKAKPTLPLTRKSTSARRTWRDDEDEYID